MSWENTTHKQKLIVPITILVVVLIIIAAFSIITILSHSGKTKVNIAIEPTNAQVFIDGNNKNLNNSSIYLTNEDHVFFAFLDGYIYQIINININEYNSEIITQLTPVSESGISANTQHVVSDEKELDAEKRTLAKLQENFPIIAYLPYNPNNGFFGITYDFNSDYTQLNININPKEKDNAIALNTACETLKNFNPDLSVSQYNIIFNNFTNILENHFQNNNETDPVNFLKTGFKTVPNLKVQTGNSEGDYYYTVIENTIPLPGTDKTDYLPYRAVLKKQNNSWTLMGTPTLLLTTYNTPDTPQAILDLVNQYNNRSQDEEIR